jgi:hypothetical protein
MNANADITIWNRYVDTRRDVWQRVVVLRVHFEIRKAVKIISAGGQISENVATIYIPWARCANYVKPRQFTLLADKADYWTLQNGDIVARGEISQELDENFTPTQLRAAYDDVYTINGVDDNSIGSKMMWHYQVGLK